MDFTTDRGEKAKAMYEGWKVVHVGWHRKAKHRRKKKERLSNGAIEEKACERENAPRFAVCTDVDRGEGFSHARRATKEGLFSVKQTKTGIGPDYYSSY